MHGGKSKKQKLVTVRVPHTATPNYPRMDFVKLFHLQAQFYSCMRPASGSESLAAVQRCIPYSPQLAVLKHLVPPLYDSTPCAPVFLARIFPLINSVLSSCISVQGNRLLLEPLLSRPHCLHTNITNGRLYLQKKSTMCLLPVLFLELLEFGGWVSSWQWSTRSRWAVSHFSSAVLFLLNSISFHYE